MYMFQHLILLFVDIKEHSLYHYQFYCLLLFVSFHWLQNNHHTVEAMQQEVDYA